MTNIGTNDSLNLETTFFFANVNSKSFLPRFFFLVFFMSVFPYFFEKIGHDGRTGGTVTADVLPYVVRVPYSFKNLRRKSRSSAILRAILIKTENRPDNSLLLFGQSKMHLFSYDHPKIGVHAFFLLSVFSVFGSKLPSR